MSYAEKAGENPAFSMLWLFRDKQPPARLVEIKSL
jgi:hypothetical protein